MSVDGHGAGERVIAVVASWPGVETAAHRFGGTEFRLGRRELGHLHGDRIADLPFTRKLRDQLIASGRARAHHVLPDSGWVTASLDGPDGAERVIELFGLSYEGAVRAAGKRTRPH
ncbi:MAG: luciferase family protein, partial [Solirubrobacteraceae bacterium]